MRAKPTIILIILTLAMFLPIILVVQKYPWPNPDFNQVDLFSNLLLEQGNLKYYDPLNALFDYPIFAPRGVSQFSDNNFMSSASIPGIIVITALFKAIDPRMPLLINLIFIFLFIAFYLKLLREFVFVENKTYKSLFALGILLFSPVFIYVSVIPFKDLLSSTFLLAAIYYSFQYDNEKNISSIILFSISLSCAVWLNYPSVVFAIPLFFIIFKSFPKIRKDELKLVYIILLIAILFAVPLIIYQIEYTGGFLKFNSPTFRNMYSDAYKTPGLSGFLLSVSFEKLTTNLINQVVFVSPLLFIGLLMFLIDFIKEKKKNKYLLVLLAILILQLIFYLPKSWTGEELTGAVATSYARYLFISWTIIALFASLYFIKKFPKKVLFFLLVALAFSSIITAFYSSGWALEYTISQAEPANQLKKDIQNNTPENSIIFVGIRDKFIYPVRKTAIYPAIPMDKRINETTNIILSLCESGYPVYIVKEKVPTVEITKEPLDFPFEDYLVSLSSRNVTLENQFENFYRVNCTNSLK